MLCISQNSVYIFRISKIWGDRQLAQMHWYQKVLGPILTPHSNYAWLDVFHRGNQNFLYINPRSQQDVYGMTQRLNVSSKANTRIYILQLSYFLQIYINIIGRTEIQTGEACNSLTTSPKNTTD